DSQELLPAYVFHLLGANRFAEHVEGQQRGASYPAITDASVKQFRVPVPPLEVQREIVRILDHFTKLEAELEAELEARRAQFEFLREVMIREASSGAAAVPLGSSASVARGASP